MRPAIRGNSQIAESPQVPHLTLGDSAHAHQVSHQDSHQESCYGASVCNTSMLADTHSIVAWYACLHLGNRGEVHTLGFQREPGLLLLHPKGQETGCAGVTTRTPSSSCSGSLRRSSCTSPGISKPSSGVRHNSSNSRKAKQAVLVLSCAGHLACLVLGCSRGLQQGMQVCPLSLQLLYMGKACAVWAMPAVLLGTKQGNECTKAFWPLLHRSFADYHAHKCAA